jgi:hypothetical protein
MQCTTAWPLTSTYCVTGLVLKPLIDNVWIASRPFIWNNIDVGGGMAVVRLSDGSLWVHSMVALDDELRQALSELGPVKHIVSPNYEHVKYAGQVPRSLPSLSHPLFLLPILHRGEVIALPQLWLLKPQSTLGPTPKP